MANEPRPVCVYAAAGLKKNSTKLLILMCVGIALALYGIYVQARIHSNPSYMPTISMASHWLYNKMGAKMSRPGYMLAGCKQNNYRPSMSGFFVRAIIKPIVHYSGIANAMINVSQIILLMVHSRSLTATHAIIGLSAFGWTISMICLGGSYATCKLMCISCLGIHHIIIIYFALRRRRILKNMLCSPTSISEGACTYGSSSSSGKSVFGQASKAAAAAADSIRRRSGRST